jgi:hypothetical protein
MWRAGRGPNRGATQPPRRSRRVCCAPRRRRAPGSPALAPPPAALPITARAARKQAAAAWARCSWCATPPTAGCMPPRPSRWTRPAGAWSFSNARRAAGEMGGAGGGRGGGARSGSRAAARRLEQRVGPCGRRKLSRGWKRRAARSGRGLSRAGGGRVSRGRRQTTPARPRRRRPPTQERLYALVAADAGAHVNLLRPVRAQLTAGHLCLVRPPRRRRRAAARRGRRGRGETAARAAASASARAPPRLCGRPARRPGGPCHVPVPPAGVVAPGSPAQVTEYASGGTLAAFLSAPRYRGGAPEPLARFFMRQLWAAVDRLHSHRVAFRDIKARPRVPRVSVDGSAVACAPGSGPAPPALPATNHAFLNTSTRAP